MWEDSEEVRFFKEPGGDSVARGEQVGGGIETRIEFANLLLLLKYFVLVVLIESDKLLSRGLRRLLR